MNISKATSMVTRVLQGVLILALIVTGVVSCDDMSLSGSNSDKAHMKVSLTDAPGDYQQVNIDVQGLRIHYTPSGSDTADTASSEGQWIDLPVEPMNINLLELTNGVDTLLAEANLEPGHYKELRLILGADNSVMVDSMIQDLKVPSGQQSGYKIKFETELQAGEEIDVVIDFDAGRSVHRAGKSGKHILKPVLKAFTEDDDEVGSIIGSVEPADADPNIYAIMGDDTTATTQADEEGDFLLQGLESGQYDLSIEPTNEQYADTTLNDITVEEGDQTDVGAIILDENE